MAEGSHPPTFKEYKIKLPAACGGCGRPLVAAHESMLLFTGHPKKAVYGYCCWLAAMRGET